jgi:predicted nuclease of predicted toxin-antitoxin system
VVTFELDFSRILAMQRLTQPSVILFRLEQFTTDGINASLASILGKYAAQLESGVIIVVDPHRVRICKLPIW